MSASDSSHCHPADSVLDTNILQSHAICPSIYGLVLDRERMHRLHHRLCSSATPLYWLLSRNLKPRKLILRAFSDFPRKLNPAKITRHTVSPVSLNSSSCPRVLWLKIVVTRFVQRRYLCSYPCLRILNLAKLAIHPIFANICTREY